MALVGFFDILGTSEAVMEDRFDDYFALDFVGAVMVAAGLFPSARFAAFSDSVILSVEGGDETTFLRAISLMYSHWFSDLVLVRGGIAQGEISWVDHPGIDESFSRLPNLKFARIYGKALVIAHRLEQRCGPGAISYMTEQAARTLAKVHKNAVLASYRPTLCWATERQARGFAGYASTSLKLKKAGSEARRHALATRHYWEQVVRQHKFLPDGFNGFPSMATAS